MKTLVQTIFFLILIFLALAGAGYLLLDTGILTIDFSIFAVILTGSLIISIIVSVLFFAGLKKKDHKKFYYIFSAIGLKFLLFLAFMGIMVLLLKNPDKEFIITFFVVYLTFTFYLLLRIIKTLKSSKS